MSFFRRLRDSLLERLLFDLIVFLILGAFFASLYYQASQSAIEAINKQARTLADKNLSDLNTALDKLAPQVKGLNDQLATQAATIATIGNTLRRIDSQASLEANSALVKLAKEKNKDFALLTTDAANREIEILRSRASAKADVVRQINLGATEDAVEGISTSANTKAQEIRSIKLSQIHDALASLSLQTKNLEDSVSAITSATQDGARDVKNRLDNIARKVVELERVIDTGPNSLTARANAVNLQLRSIEQSINQDRAPMPPPTATSSSSNGVNGQ